MKDHFPVPTREKKIKALIIDDEEDARENLRNTIGELQDTPVVIIGAASDTIEAEMLIRQLAPDVVFIDIEMPGEDAFLFLERIAPLPFLVVFVTAYHEYALKAFRINAVDYILKPISSTEIAGVIEKLTFRLAGSRLLHEAGFYKTLSGALSGNTVPRQVRFRTGNSLEIVPVADLYYLEALRAYSRVCFQAGGKGRELIISQSLAEYEDILPQQLFYRIHKSYLVNCRQVKKVISQPAMAVVMADGAVLPVSRRKYASFISFLSVDHSFPGL